MDIRIVPGQLYFNVYTNLVERVIIVQERNLVWTTYHKRPAVAYSRSNFRKATKEEVENYLKK